MVMLKMMRYYSDLSSEQKQIMLEFENLVAERREAEIKLHDLEQRLNETRARLITSLTTGTSGV